MIVTSELVKLYAGFQFNFQNKLTFNLDKTNSMFFYK